MEYTYLGETGLEVSRLCLGSAQFGSGYRPGGSWEYAVGEETCRAIVDRALEGGINFVDTANVYSTGEAEEILGRAIDGRREELVLATKVRGRMADRPNAAGLSKKHVLEQVDASLERLGTDYVDVYQPHGPDPNTPIEETLSALDRVVEAGKARYLGASNFEGWRLAKALYTSDLRGYERMVSVEPEYSLVARHEEHGSLPVAEDQGLGVMSYSPLGAGFLAGAHDREEGPSDRLTHRPEIWERLNTDANWTVYDRVCELAEEKDATPVQVSVAWLLHEDVVDSVIVGPETVAQLEEYLGALDVSLSEGETTYLEEPVDPTYPPRP